MKNDNTCVCLSWEVRFRFRYIRAMSKTVKTAKDREATKTLCRWAVDRF